MAEVSIRAATLADAARLAELSEVLGYPATAGAGAESGRRPLLVEGTPWWPGRSLGCLDVGNQDRSLT